MKLLAFFFGCRHKHTSRVFRSLRKLKPGHYVVCFDCCREIPYDWEGLGETKEELKARAKREESCA